MKFSLFAIAAVVGGVEAFAPAGTNVAFHNHQLLSSSVGPSSSFSTTTTELNGFRGFISELSAKRRRKGRGAGNRNPKTRSGQSSGKDITEDEVRALFSLWNNALATGDSRIVAKRYAKTSILLPTVSDVPRTDYESIKDYFDAFLLKKPQGQILEGDIRIGDGWAQDAGVYEFTMGATGDKVKARYTYTYVYEDKQWKIAHHHSSVMPEGLYIANQIKEDEVRGLFQLWNSALDTLDPDAVAARYTSDGVLLPTVSDTPRCDYDSIKDYFVAFLEKKPQGEILESNVMIGDNWCQDAGIYEFTMGATGDKVKARYSFVYKMEDGQWKIAHHHSSMMPEPILAAQSGDAAPASKEPVIADDDVRGLFNLWNDALATLDPDKVAARYATSNPCLLPTVSDTPRCDYDSIKAYFVDFLQKKPQGKILESYVTAGDNWCMDDGIYEFTMGATGDVVKARYSFVYTKEGDEWKIAHHHSSQMPEEIVPKAMLEAATASA